MENKKEESFADGKRVVRQHSLEQELFLKIFNFEGRLDENCLNIVMK